MVTMGLLYLINELLDKSESDPHFTPYKNLAQEVLFHSCPGRKSNLLNIIVLLANLQLASQQREKVSDTGRSSDVQPGLIGG